MIVGCRFRVEQDGWLIEVPAQGILPIGIGVELYVPKLLLPVRVRVLFAMLETLKAMARSMRAELRPAIKATVINPSASQPSPESRKMAYSQMACGLATFVINSFDLKYLYYLVPSLHSQNSQ